MRDEESSATSKPTSAYDTTTFITITLGLLTIASILLLIYQSNQALNLGIEAADVWSEYRVGVVKAATEPDPNLKKQYTEEQDVLRQHAVNLREKTKAARHAVNLSTYAALFLLLATTAAVCALIAKIKYIAYVGILLSIIGVALDIRAVL